MASWQFGHSSKGKSPLAVEDGSQVESSLAGGNNSFVQDDDEFDHLFGAVPSNHAPSLAVVVAHVPGLVIQADADFPLYFTDTRNVQLPQIIN